MGLLKRLFGKKQSHIKTAPRTLTNIKYGDFILYFDEEYEVIAVINWVEEGVSWKEYRLKKDGKSFYINVENDEGDIIAYFYTVTNDLTISSTPPDNKILYNGITYELEEKGTAMGMVESKAGNQTYKAKYWDFEDTKNEDNVLSIEKFSDNIETSTGVRLIESKIDILPGGE
jgi:hypothetical protein